jgi:hypothetical protein
MQPSRTASNASLSFDKLTHGCHACGSADRPTVPQSESPMMTAREMLFAVGALTAFTLLSLVAA